MNTVRVLRFMSLKEAARFSDGLTLRNDYNHAGMATESVGFCFAIADQETDEASIYQAARRLSGIVDMQVCLIGTLQLDPERFKQSFGYYADHDLHKRVSLPEICAVEYNSKDFSDWSLWLPNMAAGPLVYSGSWLEPLKQVAA